MKTKHYSHIGDYLSDINQGPPEHPLFAIISANTDMTDMPLDCPDLTQKTTADFYVISLKNVIEGEILYGKSSYDCDSGTMIFLAPNQIISSKGIKIKTEGYLILIHVDFLAGHPLAETINSYDFFEYSVNEALHLAPREEKFIGEIFNNIRKEYQSGYDEYSREIILSQVKTLLGYGERFYRRQFVQREINHSVYSKFTEQLENHYAETMQVSLPQLTDIAEKMHLSSRYLSDAIKVETGKAAKECMQLFIIKKAKQMLSSTEDSVTTIAYTLGFGYPQYFVRLFKNKTDMTPTEYRDSIVH